MKLKDLAQKPQLMKITVDDELVVTAFGEPVEFWMYDRQDLPTFMKLSKMKDDEGTLLEIVRELVLDEDGKRVLKDGHVLPIEILVKVIEAMIANLGNFKSQSLTT
jgi:ubiquinone biosynthesis protein Coq4